MKTPSALAILSVPLLSVLAVACSGAGSGSAQPAGSGPADPSGAAEASSSTGPTGGVELPPNDILQPVLADAATRRGISPAEVVVVSAAAVQWSDGSLGCPQPGMMYTQALVDGYQIIVRAAGAELDYRVRGPGSFKVCEQG